MFAFSSSNLCGFSFPTIPLSCDKQLLGICFVRNIVFVIIFGLLMMFAAVNLLQVARYNRQVLGTGSGFFWFQNSLAKNSQWLLARIAQWNVISYPISKYMLIFAWVPRLCFLNDSCHAIAGYYRCCMYPSASLGGKFICGNVSTLLP